MPNTNATCCTQTQNIRLLNSSIRTISHNYTIILQHLLQITALTFTLTISHAKSAEPTQEIYIPQTSTSFALRVPIQVNGKKLSFIVDTGCTFNLIDKSHQHFLSPYYREVDIDSIGGSHRSPLFTGNTLAINKLVEAKTDLLLVDLQHISNQFAKPLDGCLGMNVLRDNGFGFNGASNTLYFGLSSDRKFDITSKLTWSATKTPLTADIQIEGINAPFEIDTGADSGLSIPPEFFTELQRTNRIHSVHESQSNSTYGTHSYRSGRLVSAKIWGVVFQDIPISDSSHPRIGMDILRKFDFYFDFPNERLLIQSTARTPEPFQFDGSGLHLTSANNRIMVTKVEQSSPASDAGFIAGDCLLTLNGEHLTRYDIDTIRDRLQCPPNSTLEVTIGRRDRVYRSVIQLKDYHNSQP